MVKCLLCQQVIQQPITLKWLFSFERWERVYFCDRCRQEFMKISQHEQCLGCGRSLIGVKLCADCVMWQKQGKILLKNCSLYTYNEAMQKYFKRYKFLGDYYLRKIFASEFQKYIKANYPPKDGWEYVVIPIDQTTQEKRRFNQVKGLVSDLPTQDLLGVKERNKRKQSQKNRQERLKTPQPFYLLSEVGDLSDKKILLIDDIYTTGRTLYHAQTLLLQRGASQVCSVTLAR